jgi:predicted dehydrogenase
MYETISSKSHRKVNVAVVGLGFMGLTHLKACQQLALARILGVCGQTRLPIDGVLPGIDGNLAGSDAVILDGTVKVYRNLNEVLSDQDVECDEPNGYVGELGYLIECILQGKSPLM